MLDLVWSMVQHIGPVHDLENSGKNWTKPDHGIPMHVSIMGEGEDTHMGHESSTKSETH